MKHQPTHPENPLVSISNRWKNVFKLVLALILVGVVFSKTSFRQINSLIQDISLSWLIIVFVLFYIHTALKGLQYWVLLGRNTDYLQVLKIVLFQNAMANLVSNAAGLASYLAMFRSEQNVNIKRSGTVFVITKIGDLFSMGLFTFFSAYLVWEQIEALQGVVIFLLVGVFMGLVILLAVIIFKEKFVLQLKRLIHLLRFDQFSVTQKGLDYLQSLAEYDQKNILKMLFLAIFLSIGYLSVGMLHAYSRVKMFHIPIDFSSVVFIISISQFISLVPIQIFGGLGTREITSLYLYGLFGITEVDIPAALIGFRILSYLFHLISLGFLSIDSLLKRNKLRKNGQ